MNVHHLNRSARILELKELGEAEFEGFMSHDLHETTDGELPGGIGIATHVDPIRPRESFGLGHEQEFIETAHLASAAGDSRALPVVL